MTSKSESKPYAKEDSKAVEKNKTGKTISKFTGLDGREYNAQEMMLMNWERRIEIFLHTIAKKLLDR